MTVRTFCNGQWFEVADGLPRYDDRRLTPGSELEALQSLADAVYGPAKTAPTWSASCDDRGACVRKEHDLADSASRVRLIRAAIDDLAGAR